ncbi:hypothetical protein MRS44_016385 [Fusarium solani]|uniref:WD40-repeat-containing domain protein n=1 Tax=Fusarium solani TaxID=169388 RepID=A0A9P9HE50_FUSSL|nr:WD40-repeat-containing domain protein [Fusarium solani]KAH7254962.1 WD40-repeat-containing domain protein [Fusarium solani]KAJ3456362.1 hypothetical protein MRS44_016385 [Fusarium solani]KAJ4211258.1 hypothetical protein NW759_012738 [Fusarium solani]
MEGLGVAANVIAVVDLSVKVIAWLSEYAQDVKNSKPERARLLQAATQLNSVSQHVQQLLQSPRGAKLHASRKLAQAMGDGKAQLFWLEGLLSNRGRFSSLMWSFQKKKVEEAILELERCTGIVHNVLQVDVADVILKMDDKAENDRRRVEVDRRRMEVDRQRIAIDRLPFADGASFDSRAEQHNPTCLQNTRVELLNHINNWIHDPNGKTIFWLNGMAGTGKSTISRTIARSLASHGLLGANFFFKRGETDRGNLAKLFTTIARQLALSQPALGPKIKERFDSDPTIVGKAAQVQFKTLILDAFSACAHLFRDGTPLVIVIDALDECERDEDIKLIINLFSQTRDVQRPRLRVFVTSRPELPVRLGFSAVEGRWQDCILHEIPRRVVERDISLFLQYQLSEIRTGWNSSVAKNRQLSPNWPKPTEIQSLTESAVPLFIFAATICRFINDRKHGSPARQLEKVLQQQNRRGASKMHIIYSPVLSQQLADASADERQHIIEEFRRVVGAIVTLASPLSTITLSRLIDIPQSTIDDRLDMLHSVLSIPKSPDAPVRTLHLSFRDYLVDTATRAQNPFWIDEKAVSRNLARRSFGLMRDHLKPDICSVQNPGTRRSDMDRKLIDERLPGVVQYACLHWVYHQELAGLEEEDIMLVYSFLTHHFLVWIEALTLIDRAWQVSQLITNLQTALSQSQSQSQNAQQLSEFLADAMRFLVSNATGINLAPLQVYSSALVFAPKNSPIRQAFRSQIPPWITLVPLVEPDWDTCLRVLEGHQAPVNAVAFSLDSSILVSASLDRAVRVWNWDTGECIYELKGTRAPICATALSPDAEVVAAAAINGIIRIWSLATGACVHELMADNGEISSMAFSADSRFLSAVSSDMAIYSWSRDTGACVQELMPPGGMVREAIFSPDLKTIVSYGNGIPTKLWNSGTGQTSFTLDRYERALISPDSNMVLAYFYFDIYGRGGYSWSSKSMHVWGRNSGALLCELTDDAGEGPGTVEVAAFSPDSETIATGSVKKVQIWSSATGRCLSSFENLPSDVKRLVFSPDSKFVALALLNSTIQIWSLSENACVNILQGHSGLINSILFSPDGAVLASFSMDQTIRIWDWKRSVDEPHHPFGTIHQIKFSPDNTMIATVSMDDMLRIWNANTGECLHEFSTMEYDKTKLSIVFSDDSSLVGLGQSDKTSSIWSTRTGDCEWQFEDALGSIRLALSPDSRSIVTGLNGYGEIRVWNRRGMNFEVQDVFPTTGYEILHLALSPCSKFMAASIRPTHYLDSAAGKFQLWNLQTKKLIVDQNSTSGTRELNFGKVWFSTDGALVATDLEGRLCIWRLPEGWFISKLGEETNSTLAKVPFAAFSEKGPYVATATSYAATLDSRVPVPWAEVWNWKTEERRFKVMDLTHAIHELSFLPGERGLVTSVGECPLPSDVHGLIPNRSHQVIHFRPELRVDVRTCWVKWRDHDILKLPTDCRDCQYSVLGYTLAIGCKAGRVIIIRFDRRMLERLRIETQTE